MNTPEKGATMKELRRVHAEGNLPPAAALFMAGSKPAEELYDLQSDPYEVHNLAAEKDYREILRKMRKAHLQWVVETRDMGLIPESEIERREKQTAARYNILLDAAPDLIKRIRDVANLAIGGPENFNGLVAALDDQDAVVRYWAAIGIGNMPGDARAIEAKLEQALTDEAPCVRIAAARALLKLDKPDQALNVLKQELKSEHQWGRLRAAIVLGEAGEMARPLIPELQDCLQDQPNKYITRVANRTLNVLLGTNNQVR
jgi:uncharacterized sulfatase